MCSRDSAAAGTRANVSISGDRARRGASSSSARASSVSTAPSMTTICRPLRKSGSSGMGGKLMTRSDVVTSSGEVADQRAHSRTTPSAFWRSHSSMPA